MASPVDTGLSIINLNRLKILGKACTLVIQSAGVSVKMHKMGV